MLSIVKRRKVSQFHRTLVSILCNAFERDTQCLKTASDLCSTSTSGAEQTLEKSWCVNVITCNIKNASFVSMFDGNLSPEETDMMRHLDTVQKASVPSEKVRTLRRLCAPNQEIAIEKHQKPS